MWLEPACCWLLLLNCSFLPPPCIAVYHCPVISSVFPFSISNTVNSFFFPESFSLQVTWRHLPDYHLTLDMLVPLSSIKLSCCPPLLWLVTNWSSNHLLDIFHTCFLLTLEQFSFETSRLSFLFHSCPHLCTYQVLLLLLYLIFI